jgi:hypothetical protein
MVCRSRAALFFKQLLGQLERPDAAVVKSACEQVATGARIKSNNVVMQKSEAQIAARASLSAGENKESFA